MREIIYAFVLVYFMFGCRSRSPRRKRSPPRRSPPRRRERSRERSRERYRSPGRSRARRTPSPRRGYSPPRRRRSPSPRRHSPPARRYEEERRWPSPSPPKRKQRYKDFIDKVCWIVLKSRIEFRVATIREKYLENEIFLRSGKSQGILWMAREI